jgi:hypothetical protein
MRVVKDPLTEVQMTVAYFWMFVYLAFALLGGVAP